MVWLCLSAIAGLLTDAGLKKYLSLQKRPGTILLSLLSCSILITAFTDPVQIGKGCLFTQVLIVAGYIDYKTRLIPNSLVVAAALCGLINFHPLAALSGAALLFAVMFSAYMIASDRTGGGDVKLMSACGFTLGLPCALGAVVIGLFLHFISAIITRRDIKAGYPMAPFIGIGFFIGYILQGGYL